MAMCEDEKFLGKVLNKKNCETQVCCLEKPYGITVLQDFEWLEDAIFYTEVFIPEVAGSFFLTENGSGSTRKT